jgi:hypothetical protein
MSVAKDQVTSLLERLPNDASIEDIQYHLYVIEKVNHGLESIEKDGGLTQDEVERRLSKWIIS